MFSYRSGSIARLGLLLGALTLTWNAASAHAGVPLPVGMPPAEATALSMVPSWASFVMAADATRLRRTTLWASTRKKLFKDPDTKKSFDEFVASCKMDPTRDLDYAVLAGDPTADKMMMVVAGRLPVASLVACMKKKDSIKIETYRGQTIYLDGLETAIVFPRPGIALVTDPPQAHDVVDAYLGEGGLGRTLGSLVARTNVAAPIWGAMVAGKSFIDAIGDSGDPKVDRAIRRVVGFYGSIDLSAGLAGRFAAACGSPGDARLLVAKARDGFHGAAGELEPMGFGALMRSTKFTATGATAAVSFSLTPAELSAFGDRVAALLGAGE